MEFTAIQRSSEKLMERVHTMDESATQRETSQGNVPMLVRGVVSSVPNLLPTIVKTDVATTG